MRTAKRWNNNKVTKKDEKWKIRRKFLLESLEELDKLEDLRVEGTDMKIDFREIKYGGEDWIHLAED